MELMVNVGWVEERNPTTSTQYWQNKELTMKRQQLLINER